MGLNKVLAATAVMCTVFLAGFVNAEGVFNGIFENVDEKDGVKEISYDQFMDIRNSNEVFTLVDILSTESFGNGHIPDSVSLPYDSIDKITASIFMPEGSNVIVYCAGFKCMASTKAAKKLSALGYRVLDYKGGLEDWEEQGNELVKH